MKMSNIIKTEIIRLLQNVILTPGTYNTVQCQRAQEALVSNDFVKIKKEYKAIIRELDQ